ncbi:MAG: alpha-ketoglutarate-dependent dioxygenase AlkB [Pseudomonadota bacterium]
MLAGVCEGFALYSGYFDRTAQEALLKAVRERVRDAPFYTPSMPRSGRPMSVKMTNLGELGWVADKSGYRYQATHPKTGAAWPAMPQILLDLWNDVSGYDAPPEACLVNLYRDGAKMGLHVDQDEDAADAPVVSVSLGDKVLFRIGGPKRSDPTQSLKLSSGDVVVLGGPARHAHHGVDRTYPATSTLLDGGGRLNLTLRRVRA